MTDSASSFMAIIFGLAVFAVIVAVGWNSVQNRRILRMQGANGQETIIVAREGDEISSMVTTTETREAAPVAAPAVVVVNTGLADPAPGVSDSAAASENAVDVEAEAIGGDRLRRVVSSTE